MLLLDQVKRYGGDVLNVGMNGCVPCIIEPKVAPVLNVTEALKGWLSLDGNQAMSVNV